MKSMHQLPRLLIARACGLLLSSQSSLATILTVYTAREAEDLKNMQNAF